MLKELERQFKGRKPGVIGKYKFFSVLVPVVEKGGKIHLLYEVRADSLRTQPGEICFPGGAMEEGETKRQCALREACEELGIAKRHIRIINELDALHTYSNFTMFCFLGQISYEAYAKMKISKDEVKEVFLIPLEEILKQEPFRYKMEIVPEIRADFPYHMLNLNNGYNWRRGVSEVPIYRFDDRIIWGLTARITHNLADTINNGSSD